MLKLIRGVTKFVRAIGEFVPGAIENSDGELSEFVPESCRQERVIRAAVSDNNDKGEVI